MFSSCALEEARRVLDRSLLTGLGAQGAALPSPEVSRMGFPPPPPAPPLGVAHPHPQAQSRPLKAGTPSLGGLSFQ